MKIEDRNFILGLIVSICLTGILTLIPVWQLVIIAGIIAGLFNKKMLRGILSGAFGVLIYWLIYIIYGIIARNTFVMLDQFGALIFGAGFGWLILLIILLIGILLGALGGAIGSGIILFLQPKLEKKIKPGSEPPKLTNSEEN